tara:strand:- start:380 stop:658 length:279 start_codon:yes stop_codon:yes gene_type:complete
LSKLIDQIEQDISDCPSLTCVQCEVNIEGETRWGTGYHGIEAALSWVEFKGVDTQWETLYFPYLCHYCSNKKEGNIYHLCTNKEFRNLDIEI